MKYDKTTHRWTLEITDTRVIKDNIETIYGSEQEAERALASQSRTMYAWIYDKVPTLNKDVVEYTLAKDPRITKDIKEALLSQLEYDLYAGGNMIDKQSGIDFKTNGGMPRSRIKESQVSIQTQQILENLPTEFNIFYRGDLNVRMQETRYEVYDY